VYWELVSQFRDALRAYEANDQTQEYANLFKAPRQPAPILRLMQLVDEERAADSVIVDALVWVSKMAPTLASKDRRLSTEADRARTILRCLYIKDKRIGLAVSGMMYLDSGSQAAECLFRAALEKSPHREVRGRACYWLAMHLKAQAEHASELKAPHDEVIVGESIERRWGKDAVDRLRASDPGELRKEAEVLFERVVEEYGDVPEFGMKKGDDPLLGKAKNELHELRDLAVGKVAPEIIADDAAGTQLSLCGCRGRVVVLWFFANWCGHCVDIYPQARGIAERLDPNEITILGVNVDPDLETLRKLLHDGAITWRCWWDGADRRVCREWNISGLPMIYVIDARGVIRYRNVRAKALSTAIDALLAERSAQRRVTLNSRADRQWFARPHDRSV
jgi:thiol-disulfide isomerase/thioredoxin